jgi:tetraacyldisaccharide 4'-kinase
VGNITVGGTGKTPVVALLAGFCISRGKRVAVLSRGYGGTLHGETRLVSDGREIFLTPGEAGDEPFMLATRIPGLMVVIGPDRYKAGLFAQEQLDPDIFILDDGFQHLRLNRDLNILLLNQAKPFGNGCVLPAGWLREYRSAAKRADLVIYTRCGNQIPHTHFPDIPFRATYKIANAILLGVVLVTAFKACILTRMALLELPNLPTLCHAG